MTQRRRKGTGTIRSTPDGRFRALFVFDRGKPREELDGSPYASYEAAESALDGLLEVLSEAGITSAGLTLAAAAKRALDQRELAGYRCSKTDRDRWNAYFKNSEFARQPLASITRGDIRDFINGLVTRRKKKPLGTSTKKNVRNLLSAIYAVAIEDEIIEENPARGLKIKAAGRTDEEMRPLPWPLAKKLLDVATDEIVPIAMGVGPRSGELRSLRWPDVHVDGAKPHVMLRYGGTPAKPRKNGKVHRVPLFGIALEAFVRLRDATTEEDRQGIVFRSKTGCFRSPGRAVEPKDWAAWLKAAGISRKVRFHDLRHTCATLLLNGDLGRKWTYEEVKELLDHSSVKVTERYAKVLGTLAEKAAASMRRRDRGAIGAAGSGAIAAQARDIVQRRGSDSNRRMTVLQSRCDLGDVADFDALARLSRSYLLAVAKNDPLAHARGLELAAASLDIAERSLPNDARLA